jgi:hypothetical protein
MILFRERRIFAGRQPQKGTGSRVWRGVADTKKVATSSTIAENAVDRPRLLILSPVMPG